MRRKGNQAVTRVMNRQLILDCLRREQEMTRIDLIGVTGLSAAAISGVVGELIDEGLISEGELGKSSGGRRPISLRINYEGRYSIGIKIMGHRIDATLTDLATYPIRSCSIDLESIDENVVANACQAAVLTLLPNETERKVKLIGLGLCMPGLVDVDHGICLASHRFNWFNTPIASIVAKATGLPVWIDNDVNAYAIAQQLFGFGRAARSMIVFIIGTGVGSALIINGQIFRGAHYSTGEIGFNRDAFEPFSSQSWNMRFSEPEIQRQWAETGQSIPLKQAVAESDPKAIHFIEKIGSAFGERIALISNFVDSELVLVSGEALDFGQVFADAIRNGFNSIAVEPRTTLEIDWQNDAWTRGAAALAIQRFFAFDFQA